MTRRRRVGIGIASASTILLTGCLFFLAAHGPFEVRLTVGQVQAFVDTKLPIDAVKAAHRIPVKLVHLTKAV